MRALPILSASLVFVFGLSASAVDVCQEDGHCVSDPSLTSDRPTMAPARASSVDYVPGSFSLFGDQGSGYGGSARAASSGARAVAAAADAGGYAGDVSGASGGGSGAGRCVSAYADLPLGPAETAACLQLVAKAEAEAKKKAQEEAEANKPQQQPQQPQQPQAPQGGAPQGGGGDKGGDDKGGDACDKKLREIAKQCSDVKDQASKNCDPNNATLSSAMSKMMASGQNSQDSSFGSSNQASGGCAIGAQGMSQFAGECDNGTGSEMTGNKTAGHVECTEKCAKMIEQAMNAPECGKAGDEEKKEKTRKKLKGKKAACEKLKEVAEGARQNADSLNQCSQQAGKNAGMGAGGLGDLMKALMQPKDKAEQEEQRQEDAKVAFNQCDTPELKSSFPQVCICPNAGLTSQQCASRYGMGYNPLPMPGANPVDRAPASGGGDNGGGSVLPAGITGP